MPRLLQLSSTSSDSKISEYALILALGLEGSIPLLVEWLHHGVEAPFVVRSLAALAHTRHATPGQAVNAARALNDWTLLTAMIDFVLEAPPRASDPRQAALLSSTQTTMAFLLNDLTKHLDGVSTPPPLPLDRAARVLVRVLQEAPRMDAACVMAVQALARVFHRKHREGRTSWLVGICTSGGVEALLELIIAWAEPTFVVRLSLAVSNRFGPSTRAPVTCSLTPEALVGGGVHRWSFRNAALQLRPDEPVRSQSMTRAICVAQAAYLCMELKIEAERASLLSDHEEYQGLAQTFLSPSSRVLELAVRMLQPSTTLEEGASCVDCNYVRHSFIIKALFSWYQLTKHRWGTVSYSLNRIAGLSDDGLNAFRLPQWQTDRPIRYAA